MTNFTQSAKNAAAIYQDIDPQGMHADHIKPRASGGASTADNLRWTDPATNIRKGANEINLRGWQAEFVREWGNHKKDSFLCVAIPGAGKTFAALTVARKYIDAGNDRRVLIVVPTVNLQDQWKRAATVFGINLQSHEFRLNFKDGFVGGVVTYQSLETSADLFRVICSRCPTLVILDEPHHCGDQSSWGMRTRIAFELANRRLLLSGTPFRTDGTPIPFVEYDGAGYCLPDFRYDYPHALRDSVVRNFSFDYSRGSYDEISISGSRETYEFHGDISEDESSKRLRKILHADGDFVLGTIRLAHEKLIEVRRHIPDAAGMAVCMDQMHAERVAAVIYKETGCKPSIIVSDGEIATDTVDKFRKAKSEWVVSVRQVSEGTDIKRLHVLCYLTNATTELFFRQLIGRVCRTRYQDDSSPDAPSDDAASLDLEAFVFLPADPRLIHHARNIEQAQLRALREISDDERRSMKPREVQDDLPFPTFLGSSHDGTDRIIVCGKEYEPAQAEEIKRIASHGIPMDKAASLYNEGFRFGGGGRSERSEADPEPEEDKLKKARKEGHRLAYRLAKTLNVEVKEIHKAYKPAKQMSLAEAEAKNADILQKIMEATK